MDYKTQLVNEIIAALKIEQGIFSIGMIEDALDGISPEVYKDFFNALMGDEHEYMKPLDRIAIVSKRFKTARSHELFKDVESIAKEYYSKFYSVSGSLLDYCTANRNEVGSDRSFFTSLDFKKLKDKNSFPVFDDKELYVLNKLGGGAWLLDIKLASNSKEITDKIERIVKNAITEKYFAREHEAIAGSVRKLLK